MEEYKVNILVVDDEELNLKAISRTLRKTDYEPDCKMSGGEALEAVKRQEYELVLMDVMMPEMDGHETCRQLKAAKPDLPVIIMTGLLDDESLKKSFDSGADDYIRKPVNRIELISRMDNIMRLKKARQEITGLYDSIMKDLNVAAEIQKRLLPPMISVENNIRFFSVYEPCENVSGDIMDIIKLSPNKTVFYVGDISGHGVQAALLMTAVRSIIRYIFENNQEKTVADNAGIIISRLETLFSTHDKYMTLIIGMIDSEKMTCELINAGHPPMIICGSDLQCRKIPSQKGLDPIGWGMNAEFSDEFIDSVKLSFGDRLFLYTDGIIECEINGEMPGVDGLKNMLESEREVISSSPAFPLYLRQKLSAMGGTVDDDLTLMSMTLSNDKDSSYYAFRLPSVLHKVRDISEQCYKIIIDAGFDVKAAAEAELVITEYINNIIIHGLNQESGTYIYMQMEVGNNQLKFYVYDFGKKWRVAKKNQNMEVFATSGRGLEIIQQLTKSMEVKRLGDINETTIIM